MIFYKTDEHFILTMQLKDRVCSSTEDFRPHQMNEKENTDMDDKAEEQAREKEWNHKRRDGQGCHHHSENLRGNDHRHHGHDKSEPFGPWPFNSNRHHHHHHHGRFGGFSDAPPPRHHHRHHHSDEPHRFTNFNGFDCRFDREDRFPPPPGWTHGPHFPPHFFPHHGHHYPHHMGPYKNHGHEGPHFDHCHHHVPFPDRF
ncbi:LAMI_0F14246g1_1 [Lachancea mirantina]|uniref:LAMI_0F14246g1_1 n=1 Tax=Lachancea mirantina TaxID=1230905 RepID=A0A1G4K408_9SACH|nr:LAMI_0F14246g1_1 [Lachancea mirantina]